MIGPIDSRSIHQVASVGREWGPRNGPPDVLQWDGRVPQKLLLVKNCQKEAQSNRMDHLRARFAEPRFSMDQLTVVNILIGLAGAFVSYCLYQYFLSPLAGIPGPFTARIGLDTWIMARSAKRDAAW